MAAAAPMIVGQSEHMTATVERTAKARTADRKLCCRSRQATG